MSLHVIFIHVALIVWHKTGCSGISGFCTHGLDCLSKAAIWWCQMSFSDPQVVQQIDQLTSSIDLREDVSGEASGHCSPIERVSTSEEAKHVDTSIHNSGYSKNPGLLSTLPGGTGRLEACNKDQTPGECPPSVVPPAYTAALLSINNSGLKFNHGTTVSQIKGPKTEANALSRSQKPPPYPLNNRTLRANKGKMPIYAGRRRLLSTTV